MPGDQRARAVFDDHAYPVANGDGYIHFHQGAVFPCHDLEIAPALDIRSEISFVIHQELGQLLTVTFIMRVWEYPAGYGIH
jgi:hypothetical protein